MNGLNIRIAPVGLTLCIMQAVCITAAEAGPCSAQIEQIERALSQAGGTSNIGPTSQQTPAAQRHVQPTPQAVEQAEQLARAQLDAARGHGQSTPRAMRAGALRGSNSSSRSSGFSDGNLA